jgi:hypothetical protein
MQIERIVRKKNHANTTKKYEIRKNKCLIIKLKKKPWMWHNTELNWAKVIVPSLLVISIIFGIDLGKRRFMISRYEKQNG